MGCRECTEEDQAQPAERLAVELCGVELSQDRLSEVNKLQRALELPPRRPDVTKAVVHTEPEGGQYDKITAGPYGTSFELPDPAGFTLRTDGVKEFVD